MKKVIIFSTLLIIFTIGCKNDGATDKSIDTTALTAPTVSTVPDTIIPAIDSTVVAKRNDAGPEKKKNVSSDNMVTNKEEIRLKKVSKKGRIILELLKMNMQEKIEVDKEGVYNRAETTPLYPGGETALREFIENHIDYPDNAINNAIEGTVKVHFAVDEQGKIFSPVIISRKLGYGLEEEALRVVKQMPKWTPGQVKGKNVKTGFTLPITYRID